MAHERVRHATDRLKQLLAFSPIVGVFGHRQVGKTTLISQHVKSYATLDLRAQLERAEVVDPAGHPAGEVRFGATVKVKEADGRIETFHIVGDDEADVAVGKISWGSPLARSLIGAKVGETVKWRRPAGDTEVEIVAVEYRNSSK
jgi:transcription elongation GreA/GreB family factor